MNRSWCVLILIMILLFSTTCSAPNLSTIDEEININTHRLHIRCLGRGSTTVVIDTGMGETIENWDPIMTTLSEESRVCGYDRAGYGQSDMGPLTRDAQRAADELNLLLTSAGEIGPFLLVGHSLSGLNMQVFANSYPDEIIGLVLLYPSPIAWM